MKVIDLLKDLYDGKKVPKKIKYGSELFVFNETYKRYINDDGEVLGEFIAIDLCLNDEIEIIEQETTYEQNFTGWQLIQNGKVVASYSYNEPTLKPVDIADVEKDVKEMLEEKPKKIEKLPKHITDNACASKDLREIANKINEIIDYLLEKESDK